MGEAAPAQKLLHPPVGEPQRRQVLALVRGQIVHHQHRVAKLLRFELDRGHDDARDLQSLTVSDPLDERSFQARRLHLSVDLPCRRVVCDAELLLQDTANAGG